MPLYQYLPLFHSATHWICHYSCLCLYAYWFMWVWVLILVCGCCVSYLYQCLWLCVCGNFIAVLSDMLTVYSSYCFWPKCVKIPIFCQLLYLIFHPFYPFLLSHAVNFTHVLVLLLEHFPGWVDWQKWTPCRIIKGCCWICWWTDQGSWKTQKEGSQGNMWRWWWLNIVCSFICCMMCCSHGIILR